MPIDSDHVPPELLRDLLEDAPERSWSALHESAHRELERPEGPRFEVNSLHDAVAVARGFEMDGAPFPGDFDVLVAMMNERAHSIPHQ